MKNSGRILYLCHDSETPSGGVKMIYLHVDHLVRNGFPACVVHNREGFKIPWLSSNVPLLYIGQNLQVTPEDIIVLPEDYRAAIEAFRNIRIRKYIFCQNHYYIYKGLQDSIDWDDLGITSVFCSSEIIRKYLQDVFGYTEVPVIHCAIDGKVFKPGVKKLQIAYMPRKRPLEVDFIRQTFLRKFPEYKNIPWVPVDGLSEKEVAGILGESLIFLSTSLFEGFGLPPVEAMACGCLVVGFHGDGGLEYASEKNGFWCREGDLFDCVLKLGKAIKLIEEGDSQITEIIAGAGKTASSYSLERQEREVLNFWKRLLER